MKCQQSGQLKREKVRLRLIALDLDGVLTNGQFLMDETGREWKSFSLRDLDAVAKAQAEGIQFAFLTGEKGRIVKQVSKRFNVRLCIEGAKDKEKHLRQLAKKLRIPLDQICYVGDSDRDAPALRLIGLGLVPLDATPLAKRAAQKVLPVKGGEGVVVALLTYLKEMHLL